MGMRTRVSGFVPPDERWKQMKAVWDACEAADTEKPPEVGEFFNWEQPDDNGVEVELLAGCQTTTKVANCDVWEYNLETIREKYPQVKYIRFVNSC